MSDHSSVSDMDVVQRHILGVRVDVVDPKSTPQRIADRVVARRLGVAPAMGIVVTLNPEILMAARRSSRLRRIIAHAFLVVPDGIGVVRALNGRGWGPATRVAGVDMVEQYCGFAAELGHKVAFVGAAPGVAQRAADELIGRHPALQVVAVDDGPPNGATARRVGHAKPDVVLAAYGGGRQEPFLADYGETLGAAVGIGVGGTFDFLAGEVTRAPRIVRERGLEWLWRLVKEPWRWRRQTVLPQFFLLERLERQKMRRDGRGD